MTISDEKLHQLLNTATVMPPNSNLAERIISEANVQVSLENVQKIYAVKDSFIQQLLQSFIFPKPAYALTFSLLMGIFIGWQYPSMNMDNLTVTVSADDEFNSLFFAEVSFDE